MKTSQLTLIIVAIVLFCLIAALLFISSKKEEVKDKKTVVVVDDVYVWDRWPDWGYGTWRRGGRPWGKHRSRPGSHKWRQSGGAKRGRP